MAWQPISTAPMDMTEVIGLHEPTGRIFRTWFFAPSSQTRNWLRQPGNMRWKPTHWMPMPAPPSAKTDAPAASE